MPFLTLFLLPACTGCHAPSPDPGTPSDDGGTTDTGTRDGGTPEVATYACPGPPDDALVFSTGTLRADQVYYRDLPQGDGWALVMSAVSYVHEQPCQEVYENSIFVQPLKAGKKFGEFFYELILTIPGQGVEDWLGPLTSNNGFVYDPTTSAHQLEIGWHDGMYRWVNSLPDGMTRSVVCIGTVSPTYIYLTVLWDPTEDGPYQTNARNPMQQPIWFDAEIWATGRGPTVQDKQRSCASTGWAGVDRGDLFSGVSYPGME